MAAPLADQIIGVGVPAGVAQALQDNLPQRVTAPASATAAGTVGQWAVASGFFYACVATNTWQRVAIATW